MVNLHFGNEVNSVTCSEEGWQSSACSNMSPFARSVGKYRFAMAWKHLRHGQRLVPLDSPTRQALYNSIVLNLIDWDNRILIGVLIDST
jgi:hypothetical protein